MCQVRGVVTRDFELVLRCGVVEPKSDGVQPLAGEPQSRRDARIRTVQRIANQWMTLSGHVNPNLMSATRLEAY